MSQKARTAARNLGKVQPEPSEAKPMSAGELLSALDLTDSAVEKGLVKRFAFFNECGPVYVWGEPNTEEAWEAEAVRAMDVEERNLEMLESVGIRTESQAQPQNPRRRRRRPAVQRGEIPTYETGADSAKPKPSQTFGRIIRV